MTETGTDYVLLTAARNEAAYIEGTILSVVAQRRKPLKWVIISDGSTDKTDQIIRNYEKQHDFIVFARRDDRSGGSISPARYSRFVMATRSGGSAVSIHRQPGCGHHL